MAVVGRSKKKNVPPAQLPKPSSSASDSKDKKTSKTAESNASAVDTKTTVRADYCAKFLTLLLEIRATKFVLQYRQKSEQVFNNVISSRS